MAKHVVLGWGSLIWDEGGCPLRLSGAWQDGGPSVPIEFSRVSASRSGALTLVVDPDHGVPCTTSYAVSARHQIGDSIADLRCREGTVLKRIGFVDLDSGSQRSNVLPSLADELRRWAGSRGFSSVVWTDLPSNFDDGKRGPYSVAAAIEYLRSQLSADGRRRAKEYISQAPSFVVTPLRTALESAEWWPEYGKDDLGAPTAE